MRGCSFTGIALSLALLSMAIAPGTAPAQAGYLQFMLSPHAGYGMWGSEVNAEDQPLVGVRGGFMFHPALGIEGHFNRVVADGRLGKEPWYDSAALSGHTMEMWIYGADAFVRLLPQARLTPYVVGGWQRTSFEATSTAAVKRHESNLEAGAGVLYQVRPRMALRAELRDVVWAFKDAPDGTNATQSFLLTAGLHFTVGGGGLGDADGDGVADRYDQCADTPLGAHVDKNGCPIDGDRDGVPDGLDRCPDTPARATVDATGCPLDSDGDGIFDGIDQCPGTPAGARVDAVGCPMDSDGDGVPDGIDRCPGTPAGAHVDAQGCPTDSDGDGVFDGLDRCPNTPAGVRVDASGCPIEVSERETELLDTGRITVRNIRFQTGMWDIPPDARATLDEVGNVLVQWPDLRIEIGGHADAIGSDQTNLDLSEKRAKAVLDYLIQRFPQINAAQYTSRGYGESVPVADNATDLGRAQNRRVEFKVLNTEELRKVRERRVYAPRD